jgi:hypothetical protein
LAEPEKVTYCEEITSKKSSYLLKYFPYKCILCKRHSSDILIAQCSSMEDKESCNSSLCLQCAEEFLEFMQESNEPVQECGFCGNSLILYNNRAQNSNTNNEGNDEMDFN